MEKETVHIKQPAALKILGFTEFWDRFSYYGIQAILVLYLTKSLHLSDSQTYETYGIYTTLAFSLPLIGGYLADHYLERIPTILFGLFFMIMGNLSLALQFYHFGLACLVVGIGLFKANNASLLGSFYHSNDQRREQGFSLFYMGMNLGAIIGPICLGLLSTHLHWISGFLINSIGIFIGASFFLYHYRYLTNTIKFSLPTSFVKKYGLTFISIFIASIAIAQLFLHPTIFPWIIWPTMAIIFLMILYRTWQFDQLQRKKLLLLIMLIIFALFFFACSLQVGSSVTIFIDRFVNRQFFGTTIPTATFSALEPFFVILSAIFVIPLLQRFSHTKSNHFVIIRIIIGLLLAAMSFFLFSLVAHLTANGASKDNVLLGIIASNLCLGIGELLIGPTLISAVTYLAPASLQGTFMGFWYFTIAFASFLGSLLAKLNVPIHRGHTSPLLFAHNFMHIAYLILGMTLVFALLSPKLYRLTQQA